MGQRKSSATGEIIKRLTGADLDATRAFLRKQCFVEGQGFRSQYADQRKVSCATTAICIYALSQTGSLAQREKDEFQRLLLAFRLNQPTGAFPRTTGYAPSVWTTGQAALALSSINAPWQVVQPSVEWLLHTQAPRGGWNFPGTDEGHERLIYAFYPTLVLRRYRQRLGARGSRALTRVAAFLNSSNEGGNGWWSPLREHLQRLTATRNRNRGLPKQSLFASYRELFEVGWP
jgi:hypothetical protein